MNGDERGIPELCLNAFLQITRTTARCSQRMKLFIMVVSGCYASFRGVEHKCHAAPP